MSREPSLGPLGKPSMAATGIQRGGHPLAARRRSEQQSAAHVPTGNQAGARAVQPGVNSSPAVRDTNVRNGAAADDGESVTAGNLSWRAEDVPVPLRPSLDGGVPALQRELGAHGRDTVRRLLEAGLVEFEEAGFQGARVEDIVRRAKTSHGTFYLYFANKDDLFRTLLRDALVDMANITDEFPVVTGNDAGRTALRRWVQSFCDTYAAHATVIRILSQAEIVGESVFSDGLQLFFRLSEVMTQGMTAAQVVPADEHARAGHAELTAVACLMMLERINYLMSAEVRLPRDEMIDRLTAIIYAAFRS
jgi:AcrR family transcriptional regulator